MEELLERAQKAYNEEDYNKVVDALKFATECHNKQVRNSGEPYIIHPINVAITLIKLGLDHSTIIAALLHDVVEDTDISEEQIKQKFGDEINTLVTGVTKLSRIKFVSQEEEQAENIRKLFFAMSKDLRILLIKLADRLHNMRTLGFLPPDKQYKKAKETLDIYAPLAGRLGISNIKVELEDLSMKYLYPEEYKYLSTAISLKRDERMTFVDRITVEIESQLKDLGIEGEVKGRPKHFYSIYKKMKNQNKTLDQIYDLVAIRVVVGSIRDCYTVLGIIHSIWKPMPGRFKDYIAMPKPNMYQSLHTTVVTNFGQTFEIQIRTFEMNKIAEYGIAAHWKYKEGKNFNNLTDFESRLGWIKQVMDMQGELNTGLEFIDALKFDVLSNDIYVFTPKGDVFDLIKGATCIDFAYRIHSAVGNKCVGAKVNNRIVTLNYELQLGDICEILTSNNSKGPSWDWLKIIKTPTAKTKIKAFFKKENEDVNIKLGKEMLDKEAKHRGYVLSDLLHESYIKVVLDRYAFQKIDDVFAAVGYGGITTNQILVKLIACYKKDQAFKNPIIIDKQEDSKPKKITSGIKVDGYDDFLIKVSHCCNPVPGDAIVGYISRGRGVTIHRTDCPNMGNLEKERMMTAEWQIGNSNYFTAQLKLLCVDKSGLLNQISSEISNLKIGISSIEARVRDSVNATMNIGVQIQSSADLDKLIRKLKSLESVIDVKRGN